MESFGEQTPVDQALALVQSLTGASGLLVETGASQTRWGVGDPGGHLPVVKTTVVVPDASADGQFATHSVVKKLGIRCLVGAPLQAAPHRPVVGTLWAFSTTPDAFAFPHLEAIARVSTVIGGLLSPSTPMADLERLVMALPTPAAAVMNGRVVPNAQACSLTGYGGDEITTIEQWFNALYRNDGPMVRELYEADRLSGFLDSRTAPITRKDGWERLVQFHSTTIGEGELWMLADITERVASQERFRLLFEQSSTPHLLTDATGIVDCNAAAVALLDYRSKSDLLRLSIRQLSPEFQPDGSRSEQKESELEALAFEQGSHRYDWLLRTASGRDVPVEVTLTPQAFGAQRVLLVEWHDLTERVQYEEGLKKARDSAMDYARAKSEFLAVMSHEIRTPMNGVIGMTRLLLDTSLSPQQKEYVDSLRACGEGLMALLNDLLDFSKLEAGKVTLEAIPLSLRDLVDEAVSVLSDVAEAKGLSMAVLIEPNVPERVLGDPTRLRQVLLNLLSNAVKFTAHGGVEVRVRPGGLDGKGRQLLTLAVKDSGIGVAPQALPRLFSSFSQEDSSTTRRFGGTGLGLAICKRLIGLMKGDITVQTGPSGSTFSIELALETVQADEETALLARRRVLLVGPPSVARQSVAQMVLSAGAFVDAVETDTEALDRAEEFDVVVVDDEAAGVASRALAGRLVAPERVVGVLTSKRTPAAEFPPGCFRLSRPVRRRSILDAIARAVSLPSIPSSNSAFDTLDELSGLRVLVAEDNLINQRVIRGLLGKLGCTVVVAENGAAALAALENQPFDVVLMDCQMPVLDGFEATAKLRELHGPNLPVIALTAGTMEGDRQRCLAAGMNDFLAKPVRPEDLLRVLIRFRDLRLVASVGT